MGAALLLVSHLIWRAYQIRYFAGARADPLAALRPARRWPCARLGRRTAWTTLYALAFNFECMHFVWNGAR